MIRCARLKVVSDPVALNSPSTRQKKRGEGRCCSLLLLLLLWRAPARRSFLAAKNSCVVFYSFLSTLTCGEANDREVAAAEKHDFLFYDAKDTKLEIYLKRPACAGHDLHVDI